MIVGLTGGIGSGKTTVARLFKNLGIPIYIADESAKELLASSEELRTKITQLLGNNAYNDKGLNSTYIAEKVFNDKDLLSDLNQIVHPAVQTNFLKWYKTQDAPYVIKEAAILFENGAYKKCDYMILVTAPLQVRINRVRKRDNTTEEAVLDRIKNQWGDAQKMSLSDAVIENNTLSALEESVLRIHNHLMIRISRAW